MVVKAKWEEVPELLSKGVEPQEIELEPIDLPLVPEEMCEAKARLGERASAIVLKFMQEGGVGTTADGRKPTAGFLEDVIPNARNLTYVIELAMAFGTLDSLGVVEGDPVEMAINFVGLASDTRTQLHAIRELMDIPSTKEIVQNPELYSVAREKSFPFTAFQFPPALNSLFEAGEIKIPQIANLFLYIAEHHPHDMGNFVNLSLWRKTINYMARKNPKEAHEIIQILKESGALAKGFIEEVTGHG